MPIWKPNLLDNLQFWVRGDSLQSQTDGSDITFWADESGNGLHVEKDSSVNAPDVVQSAQNDLPVADFLSSNTEVLWGPANVSEFGDNPFYITGVFKTVTTGNDPETVFSDNADNNLYEFRYTGSTDRPIKYFGRSAPADSAFVNVSTNMTMAAYTRIETVASGGDAKWYVNGKLESSETETGDYTDTDATTGLFVVGASGTKASILKPLNGQVCEIIMYSDTLTDAERILLEGYLANKWDSTTLIESDGGSDHTYKTKRPLDGITLLGEDISNETMSRSLEGDLFADINMVDYEHGGSFVL